MKSMNDRKSENFSKFREFGLPDETDDCFRFYWVLLYNIKTNICVFNAVFASVYVARNSN